MRASLARRAGSSVLTAVVTVVSAAGVGVMLSRAPAGALRIERAVVEVVAPHHHSAPAPLHATDDRIVGPSAPRPAARIPHVVTPVGKSAALVDVDV